MDWRWCRLAFGQMLEEYDPTDDGKYQKLVYVEDCADTLNFSMMSTGEASTHWAWHQDLVKGGDTFFLVYTVTNRASLEALHEIHSQSFGPDKELAFRVGFSYENGPAAGGLGRARARRRGFQPQHWREISHCLSFERSGTGGRVCC
ncbi:hypothetical protein EDB81DRAFT_766600 [Dactylonectria macrodidyma]|uniref:Uncharacterized protein n=1 Tax=Dactylonectria macrodidyma TaxID=307937 RepID=A0A9P9III0_9HYPO|nr:hypothetical protein EDB81DRAFT_766600 [Dactylonectria macrodidyma]